MAAIKNIFLHCSASDWGDVLVINDWHKRRGWPGIGYHFVVLNSRVTNTSVWDILDGMVQPGHYLDADTILRPNEIGYHVEGRNHDSIGVCLIGTTQFTTRQLLSAHDLMLDLLKRFDLQISDVLGHYEDPNTSKTCPNIPMPWFRTFLAGSTSLATLQAAITGWNSKPQVVPPQPAPEAS
jgi:hypothetical protein